MSRGRFQAKRIGDGVASDDVKNRIQSSGICNGSLRDLFAFGSISLSSASLLLGDVFSRSDRGVDDRAAVPLDLLRRRILGQRGAFLRTGARQFVVEISSLGGEFRWHRLAAVLFVLRVVNPSVSLVGRRLFGVSHGIEKQRRSVERQFDHEHRRSSAIGFDDRESEPLANRSIRITRPRTHQHGNDGVGHFGSARNGFHFRQKSQRHRFRRSGFRTTQTDSKFRSKHQIQRFADSGSVRQRADVERHRRFESILRTRFLHNFAFRIDVVEIRVNGSIECFDAERANEREKPIDSLHSRILARIQMGVDPVSQRVLAVRLRFQSFERVRLSKSTRSNDRRISSSSTQKTLGRSCARICSFVCLYLNRDFHSKRTKRKIFLTMSEKMSVQINIHR